jgi:hypothetical protein
MTESPSPPVRCLQAGAGTEPSLYERIGGAEKVEWLVAAFYARVDSDPVIRPLHGKTLSWAIHCPDQVHDKLVGRTSGLRPSWRPAPAPTYAVRHRREGA